MARAAGKDVIRLPGSTGNWSGSTRAQKREARRSARRPEARGAQKREAPRSARRAEGRGGQKGEARRTPSVVLPAARVPIAQIASQQPPPSIPRIGLPSPKLGCHADSVLAARRTWRRRARSKTGPTPAGHPADDIDTRMLVIATATSEPGAPRRRGRMRASPRTWQPSVRSTTTTRPGERWTSSPVEVAS